MKKVNKSGVAAFSQKAEAFLETRPSKVVSQSSEAKMQKLIHELKVDEVVLKTQNEELVMARTAEKDIARKYTELYDFAPSAYFTLSNEGEIVELNFTGSKMLGKERSKLLKSRFGFIVSNDTKPIFNQFLERAFYSNKTESCEVTLSIDENSPLYVYITGTTTENEKYLNATVLDITSRRKMEESLQESEELFRSLVQNSENLTILTDKNGVATYLSPQCEKVLGYHGDKLLGQNMPDFIFPDDKARVQTAWEQVILNGHDLIDFEYRIIDEREEVRWISHSAKTVMVGGKFLGVQNNIRNITERKLNEGVIQESLQRLELAMLVANMAWWEMDIASGNVTFEKRKAEFLGFPPEKFKHYTDFMALVHPEDYNLAMDAMSGHINGLFNKYEVDYRILTKSGEYKWFHDIGSIVKKDSEGKPLYLTGLVVEITDRKKSEEKIINLNNELEQRVLENTSQLEALNKDLEAFTYSVSHDLRAPVRHINGFKDMLKDKYHEQLPDEAKHYLDVIGNASHKMGVLIDDLLSFSRTGRQEIIRSSIKMNNVVQEALSEVKSHFADRDIDWDISIMPEVIGDYNLLRQVWINLLDNAAKYTQTREKAKIKVSYKKEIDEYVFSVKDNGVGFDMQYAQKLFGVFQRLHSSQFEGTGIGLANVRRIILSHGGRTWADAEVDNGAAFYFSLPVNVQSLH